ncbi:MAG: EscU/YscU/HrcU family type III secretion system export apparatus switch protein [Desulfobacterales bacterium]|nr:EscU/YscU/HrcU family type III secretion system export apparatus switch protein [Desulfobacterales bacterium]
MTSRKEYDKAVALRYKPGLEKAPRVIAAGKGKIAEKIIRIAKEHNIHVHNDPDLVEMLSELELNSEIPPELYVVVSEILVFVYSLNRKETSG